ncbi:HAMP domain-containing protein [Leucothrix sargassi]|nr:HAMP domain-containing protein [Leucothrix sargassi]
MWKNLNFSVKVITLVMVLMLFTLLTGVGYHKMTNQIKVIGIQSAGDEMLAGYKSELKDIVTVMAATLASATKGMTDEREVIDTYHELSRDVRFFPDKSGYFFIYKETVNVMLPTIPRLEGKDLIDVKDVNGVRPVIGMLKAANAGGGFFEYVWERPNKGTQPKLSYAKRIPNSPFIIGTGVYIDDIEQKEQRISEKMNDVLISFLMKWFILLAVVFFLIILPLMVIMIKSISTPLERLTEIASGYSKGALDSDIEYTERKDEIGALSRAIKRLGKSTKMIMKKLDDAG